MYNPYEIRTFLEPLFECRSVHPHDIRMLNLRFRSGQFLRMRRLFGHAGKTRPRIRARRPPVLFGPASFFAVFVSPAPRPVAFPRATVRSFASVMLRAALAPMSSRPVSASSPVGIALTTNMEIAIVLSMRRRWSVFRSKTWRRHHIGVRHSAILPITAFLVALWPGLAPRGAGRIPVSIAAFRWTGNTSLPMSGRQSSHGVGFVHCPVFQLPTKNKTKKQVFSFAVAGDKNTNKNKLKSHKHTYRATHNKNKTGTYWYLTYLFRSYTGPPTKAGPCFIP